MHQELVNFDKVFHALPKPPVMLNDLDLSTEAGKVSFNQRLMMLYTEEHLSNVPHCNCYNLEGGQDYGDECEICGSKCVSEFEKPIEAELWLRAPEGIPYMVNPAFWIMLDSFMTSKQTSMLQYLTDPLMVVDETIPWVRELKQANVPRGLVYFTENFDAIMELVYVILKTERKVDRRNEMRKLIEENRQNIFCKYLAVPNRLAFSIEKNDYGRFADDSITMAINAVRGIVAADDGQGLLVRKRPLAKKESMVVGAMMDFAAFYHHFVNEIAGKKYGLFRQNIFGMRSHFTARGVIVSLAQRHLYKEIHLPWSMGVQLFKLHIQAKLLAGDEENPPMSIIEQERLLIYATNNYHPYIDKILQTLIAEAPRIDKYTTQTGIGIILQRNPSLARGSAQNVFVTKFLTDPRINALALSLLILAAFNADHDGDELNLSLICDNVTLNMLGRLEPKFGTMDLNTPRAISSNLALPKPLISTIDHYQFEEDQMLEGELKS